MTIDGSTVHRAIKGKIAEVEGAYERHSACVYGCERKIELLTEEREQCYVQLAEFYLPELDANAIKETISEVQGEVKRIFAERRVQRARAEQKLKDERENKKALEEKLTGITEELEQKVSEREEIKAAIATDLSGNKEYAEFFPKAEQTKSRIEQNMMRVKEIETEAKQKLPAYDQNRLFKYLLRRKFGTPDYDHGWFVRRLDQWVASLVNYNESKRNYDYLRTMPELMKAEFERRNAELDELAGKVQKIEQDTAERHGLNKVVTEGMRIGVRRDKAIKEVEKSGAKCDEYTKEISDLDNTKGEHYSEAIQKLKSYLKGSNVAELKRRALETPERKDDNLVEKIEEIDLQVKEQKGKAKEIKAEQSEVGGKLSTLQRIENGFTSKDYESSRSYFDAGFDINSLIAGFIAGKMTESNMWGQIESSQHFRPQVTYTYRPTVSRRSVFDDDDDDDSHSRRKHNDHGSSRRSSDDSDSGSGFGGGSFSSGGGFGGGGFSSGSGF